MSGRFITFEGIDGAGKSTHVEWFAQVLRARGHDVVVTREPGGTALAEKLRVLLLNEPMSIEAETLLMFAARREHLDGLIRPALARGTWVVCDRFTDSTFAYQGAGRGVPTDAIESLERWIHGDLQPSLTFLFDLPAELAAQRRAAARSADRFESEDLEFFARVRAGYHARRAAAPARFRTIDGRQSIEAIRRVLEESLASL
jgi:dTMP kinase